MLLVVQQSSSSGVGSRASHSSLADPCFAQPRSLGGKEGPEQESTVLEPREDAPTVLCSERGRRAGMHVAGTRHLTRSILACPLHACSQQALHVLMLAMMCSRVVQANAVACKAAGQGSRKRIFLEGGNNAAKRRCEVGIRRA